jgi:uncharacterized protein YqjF (DUF2071 family)
LLFVHWAVPAEKLRALVPEPLVLDTHGGEAFVGLIPFDMPEVRPVRGWPAVPTAGRLLETNLRTYVRLGDAAGVWFFSLDAASTLAVIGARVGFGLPYFRARMAMERGQTRVRYQSQRLPPGPRPAALEVEYEIGAALGPAAPGTLEHFLVERYLLFARRAGRMVQARVRHTPYPLRRALVSKLDQTLTAAAGISDLGTRTVDLYSEGVDVDIFPAQPAAR